MLTLEMRSKHINDQNMALPNSFRLLFSALLFAGITLFTGQAWATFFIPINNFSFESPASTNAGTLCSTTAIPGWTCSDPTNEGVYVPTSTNFPVGSNGLTGGLIVPDGNQAAFMNKNSGAAVSLTSQLTASTVSSDKTYNLSAWVGTPVGSNSGTSTLQLLATNTTTSITTVIASQSFANPTAGHWALETLSFHVAAGNPTVGQRISVGLLGNTQGNSAINWDDVILVPEPPILLLLAMGFGALAAFTRRKKTNLA